MNDINKIRKRCIVVLGMHRSGTSAFAGLLHILGVSLGLNIMSPTDDNPKGFFENDKIVQLNENILKSLNFCWYDVFMLPAGWQDNKNIKIFKKEAIEIIESEFKDGLFCIKDPRMSKLFPFWSNIFEELNIKPYFIIAVRNPLEVAYSLKKRNSFSAEKSTLLWLNHMLDAELYSRNSPRIFVSFDDLLKEPESVINAFSSILNIKFPHSYNDVKTDIEHFLQPDLKHYTLKDDLENERFLDLISDYYRVLLDILNKEIIGEPELLKIDHIRDNFITIYKYFYNAENNYFIQDLKDSYELKIKDLKDTYEYLKDSYELKIEDIESTLDQIYNTRSWRLIQQYYLLRDKMLPYGTRRRRSFEMILKMPGILKNLSRTDVFTKENISQSIRYIRLYGISGFTEKVREKLERRGYRINRYFLEALKRTHLDEEPWKSITLQPYDKDTSMLEICKKLREKYPGYSEVTGDFTNADSLKEIQETLEVLVDYHTKGEKRLYSFIEHMGGGSDFFVQSLTEQLIKKGIMTMRFKYDFSERSLVMIYHNDSLRREFAFTHNGAKNPLKDAFDFFKFDYVFINQMISWPNVMDIIHILIEVDTPYVIFTHDNFYLCPSWNLINNEGRFCNLPDLAVCKNCLPNNKFSSHNLYYRSFLDISQWRREMHGFLRNAKYIISPSESTKNQLLTVYEDLQNVVVLEHFESAFPHRNIKRHFTGNELVVGILGDIGYHKGDKILKELVARLKSEALPIKMVVIGYTRSFPAPYKSADGKFFIHGRYNRLDLPDLLERYNINVILIPSICPETFSYTISEAMLLRYPLICFNIGAQAERVKEYNCGIIVNDISVEGVIAAFKELLQNPGMIETLSSNASKFVPQSGQEYMERLLKLLDK